MPCRLYQKTTFHIGFLAATYNSRPSRAQFARQVSCVVHLRVRGKWMSRGTFVMQVSYGRRATPGVSTPSLPLHILEQCLEDHLISHLIQFNEQSSSP